MRFQPPKTGTMTPSSFNTGSLIVLLLLAVTSMAAAGSAPPAPKATQQISAPGQYQGVPNPSSPPVAQGYQAPTLVQQQPATPVTKPQQFQGPSLPSPTPVAQYPPSPPAIQQQPTQAVGPVPQYQEPPVLQPKSSPPVSNPYQPAVSAPSASPLPQYRTPAVQQPPLTKHYQGIPAPPPKSVYGPQQASLPSTVAQQPLVPVGNYYQGVSVGVLPYQAPSAGQQLKPQPHAPAPPTTVIQPLPPRGNYYQGVSVPPALVAPLYQTPSVSPQTKPPPHPPAPPVVVQQPSPPSKINHYQGISIPTVNSQPQSSPARSNAYGPDYYQQAPLIDGRVEDGDKDYSASQSYGQRRQGASTSATRSRRRVARSNPYGGGNDGYGEGSYGSDNYNQHSGNGYTNDRYEENNRYDDGRHDGRDGYGSDKGGYGSQKEYERDSYAGYARQQDYPSEGYQQPSPSDYAPQQQSYAPPAYGVQQTPSNIGYGTKEQNYATPPAAPSYSEKPKVMKKGVAHRLRCSHIAIKSDDECQTCCQLAARRDRSISKQSIIGFVVDGAEIHYPSELSKRAKRSVEKDSSGGSPPGYNSPSPSTKPHYEEKSEHSVGYTEKDDYSRAQDYYQQPFNNYVKSPRCVCCAPKQHPYPPSQVYGREQRGYDNTGYKEQGHHGYEERGYEGSRQRPSYGRSEAGYGSGYDEEENGYGRQRPSYERQQQYGDGGYGHDNGGYGNYGDEREEGYGGDSYQGQKYSSKRGSKKGDYRKKGHTPYRAAATTDSGNSNDATTTSTSTTPSSQSNNNGALKAV